MRIQSMLQFGGALLQRYWLHISDRFERAKLRAGRSFAAARSWWWASHDLCNETTAFVVGREILVNAGCMSRGLTGRPRDTFSSDGNGNWGFSRTAPRSERQSGPPAGADSESDSDGNGNTVYATEIGFWCMVAGRVSGRRSSLQTLVLLFVLFVSDGGSCERCVANDVIMVVCQCFFFFGHLVRVSQIARRWRAAAPGRWISVA